MSTTTSRETHTQESWRYEELHDGRESLGLRIYDAQNNIVANIYGNGCLDFDNARLIAAAPAMLEALRAVKALALPGATHIHAVVDAALSKASQP